MNTEDERKQFFDQLYLDNYKKLLSVTAGEVPLPHLQADDIVQDTFLLAWQNLDKLKNHPNPGGWLRVTAKNILKERKRRFHTRSRYEDYDPVEDIEYFCREYGEVELADLIDRILTPQEKILFKMCYLEGYSLKELAAAEQITGSAMKVRFFRMREKLQKGF